MPMLRLPLSYPRPIIIIIALIIIMTATHVMLGRVPRRPLLYDRSSLVSWVIWPMPAGIVPVRELLPWVGGVVCACVRVCV